MSNYINNVFGDENKKVSLKIMRCPSCGAPLNVEDEKSTIVCVYCGNTIVPVTSNNNTNNSLVDSNKDKVIARIEGIKTSSSAIAYMEQLFDSYNWEEYVYANDIEIFELANLVESLKVTSSDDKKTWLLSFESIYYPLTKKIEGLNILYSDIIKQFKDDNPDCFTNFDTYKSIVSSLKNNYNLVVTELERCIKYAKKYDATDEEISLMNDKLNYLSKVNDLEFADDIYKVKEINEYHESRNSLIIDKLSKQGIDAPSVYVEALQLIKINRFTEALEKLYTIEEFSNSKELINKINKKYEIFDIIEICGNLYYTRKSTNNVNLFDLYETSNGKINLTPLIKNIKKIVANYASIIYFIGEDNKLRSLNLFNNASANIVKAYSFDASKINMIDSNVFLVTTYNPNQRGVDVLQLDIKTGNLTLILKGIKNVVSFYESKIVYSKYRDSQSSVFDTCIYDINNQKTDLIELDNISVKGFINDNVIFTKAAPNNKNYFLYTKELNNPASKIVILEKNIYRFSSILANKIFFYIGNSKHNTMINMNVDGTDRTQLPLLIYNVLFEKGDYIYFIKKSGYNSILCRSYADGSNYSIIAKDVVYYTIKNGYFYFKNTNGYLNKIRLDGSNLVKLCNNVENPLAINNYKTIYLSSDDNVDFKAMNNILQRRNVQSIYANEFSSHGISKLVYDVKVAQYYDEDTIYFIKEVDIDNKTVECLYKIDVKSNKITKLLELRSIEKKNWTILIIIIIVLALLFLISIASC